MTPHIEFVIPISVISSSNYSKEYHFRVICSPIIILVKWGPKPGPIIISVVLWSLYIYLYIVWRFQRKPESTIFRGICRMLNNPRAYWPVLHVRRKRCWSKYEAVVLAVIYGEVWSDNVIVLRWASCLIASTCPLLGTIPNCIIATDTAWSSWASAIGANNKRSVHHLGCFIAADTRPWVV